MKSNKLKNGALRIPTVVYANGGLKEYKGASHEQGGIQKSFGEVEGGETEFNDYIYSKRLGTAKESKMIEKRYRNTMPTDYLANKSKKQEMDKLAMKNEMMKQVQPQMMMGGMKQYARGGKKVYNPPVFGDSYQTINQAQGYSKYEPSVGMAASVTLNDRGGADSARWFDPNTVTPINSLPSKPIHQLPGNPARIPVSVANKVSDSNATTAAAQDMRNTTMRNMENYMSGNNVTPAGDYFAPDKPLDSFGQGPELASANTSTIDNGATALPPLPTMPTQKRGMFANMRTRLQNTTVNTPQDNTALATAAAMAPMVGQSLRDLTRGREQANLYLNSEKNAALQLMSENRLDSMAMINEAQRQALAARMNNNTRSAQVNNALNQSMNAQQLQQIQQIKLQESQANNQYRAQEASMRAQLGAQEREYRSQQDIQQSQNDAMQRATARQGAQNIWNVIGANVQADKVAKETREFMRLTKSLDVATQLSIADMASKDFGFDPEYVRLVLEGSITANEGDIQKLLEYLRSGKDIIQAKDNDK